MKIKEVVGIAFIEDNRLLIVQSRKSRKTNSYTFIGGGVEEGETLIQAAKRETSEEINGFAINDDELELVFEHMEQAASDPNLTISMHVFLAHKKIDVPLIPNEEILDYHWYSLDDNYNVSNSIKDFLDYALENEIIKKNKKR